MNIVIPPQVPNAVAIDVEATGLNPWRGDYMFSCAAAWLDGSTRFWRDDFSGLDRLLADDTVDKVFHNAKYDLRMLERKGFRVRGRVWDTMIFGHLLNGLDAEGGLGLDAMSRKYLPSDKRKVVDEINTWFDEHRIGKDRRGLSFGILPPDLLERRNVGDADLTIGLFKRLYATVAHYFPFLLRQEHELLHVVKRMEDRGICVDLEEMERQKQAMTDIIDDVRQFCEGVTGWPEFIITNRNHQLELLDRAGLVKVLEALPREYKTKKGAVKLDDFNLRSLHHPVAHMLVMGKAAIKMRDTFIAQLERSHVNGVVHASFNQVGTLTGRFSSSDPNLTNIPVEGERRAEYTAEEDEEAFTMTGHRLGQHIKRIFVCRPGYAHIHSDKSRAEIIMMAHYTNDKTLIDIMEAGLDIHDELCMRIFGERTKGLRTRAKRLVFGFMYGAGIKTMANKIGTNVSRAIEMRKRLEQIAPGMPRWVRDSDRMIRERGYVETIHGRRHYLAPRESYKSVNRFCQSTVADEIKSRMVAIENEITASRPAVRQLLCVHDDIGTEVPIEEVKAVAPEIKRVMNETSVKYRLSMPSSLDITFDRWANLKEIDDVNSVEIPERYRPKRKLVRH